MKRAVAILFVAQFIALGTLAQNTTSSEFGRVTSGVIELIPKHPKNLSGSLLATFGGLKGYEASVGGTILDDKLWFFATAQQNETRLQLPAGAVSQAVDAKLTGQLGDQQSLAAFFSNARQTPGAVQDPFTRVLPSQFLSLHYTGIVSSNMLFNVSVTRQSQ